jgi:hypothetical protein
MGRVVINSGRIRLELTGKVHPEETQVAHMLNPYKIIYKQEKNTRRAAISHANIRASLEYIA